MIKKIFKLNKCRACQKRDKRWNQPFRVVVGFATR